nr:SLATT domain-containing protein [uncultured Draconibacterium sp.]
MANKEGYSVNADWLEKNMSDQNIDKNTIGVVKGLIEKSEMAINWYWRGKAIKRGVAVPLRFISLLLAGGGAVFPIIDSMEVGYIKDGLGFKISVLLFVIAGAINLFDKFFGLSSGWMRYTITAMRMERELNLFVLVISGILVSQKQNTETGADKKKQKRRKNLDAKMMDASKEFSSTFYDLLLEETTEWASEFRNSIANIEKLIKSKSK